MTLIGDIPQQAGRRFGGKPAIIDGDRVLDYASLNRRADAAAAMIVAAGVAPGETVTRYGENSLEWVVAYHAIARAGCVINPLNALLTSVEVEFVLADCHSRLYLRDNGPAQRRHAIAPQHRH